MLKIAPITAKTADSESVMSGAEERYLMLRRLASLGMCLAEEVCERAINSPYHPEPVHEPARAFATVSRAVRLTIVLQTRFEADWFAFRDSGVLPTGLAFNAKPSGPGATPPATPGDTTAVDDCDDTALDTLDRARENLHEYERFDEILSRPFDDCVAAIRTDLGLEPDADVSSEGTDAALATDGVKVVHVQGSGGVTEWPDGVSARRFSGLDPPDTA